MITCETYLGSISASAMDLRPILGVVDDPMTSTIEPDISNQL